MASVAGIEPPNPEELRNHDPHSGSFDRCGELCPDQFPRYPLGSFFSIAARPFMREFVDVKMRPSSNGTQNSYSASSRSRSGRLSCIRASGARRQEARELVTHDGSRWFAKCDSTGLRPGRDPNVWQLVLNRAV